MKNSITLSLLILAFVSGFNSLQAQTDSSPFNFQGYAQDPNGNALGSANINVRFSLYPEGGSVIFEEEHTTQSDPYGVFSLFLGSIKPNDFKAINFSTVRYWLKVEVKRTTDGVYTTISDAALMSVPYARSAANGVPVGTIVSFAGPKQNVPAGWLVCDGTAVSQANYPQLYAAIGNSWGGSGTNFNLPDLRGMFLRGVDETKGNDPDAASRTASASGGNTGNNVGTIQSDEIATHKHGPGNLTGGTSSDGAHQHSIYQGDHRIHWGDGGGYTNHRIDAGGNSRGTWLRTNQTGNHTHSVTVNSGNTAETGGDETRPINAYVFYIIKY